MKLEVILHSKNAFLVWVRSEPRFAEYTHARLIAPAGIVVWQPGTVPGNQPPRGFTRVHLPAVDTAAGWWEDVFNGEIIDYWFHEGDAGGALVCAAKAAVWAPSASLYAELGVADFTRVDDGRFQQIVGRRTAESMWNEVRLVGFSVRKVSAAEVKAYLDVARGG